MHLMSQSKNCISALELHRLVDLPYKTALHIKHKIMEMMFESDKERIGSYVEINETQLEISPVEKNNQYGHSKRTFIAALQTSVDGRPQMIKLRPMNYFKREKMESWLEENICTCCEAICDSQHCYETMCGLCKNKAHMNILLNKTKRGANWMNIILSNIKASIYGTYHTIDFNHYGHLYLGDFQYRFNRRFNLKKMFYELVASAARYSYIKENVPT